MSGHSHWSKIKHQKGVADIKRGQTFSKMVRLISVAAKEGGSDPDKNPKLRLAIERAKSLNMPKENIERAVKKGSGELQGVQLEEFIFEAYGPGGIAIIVEGITDNKNRTMSEIKKVLSQNNGKLAGEGSVRWLFERKGVLSINSKNQESKTQEDLELMLIEIGAENIIKHEYGFWDVFTKTEEVYKTKEAIEKQGVAVESMSLDWIAKEEIDLPDKEKESCNRLFDLLDENDSVQEIYSNLKD